jgi:gamma-glutamyl-gamma-aminobutyrate hydrolase PuuD
MKELTIGIFSITLSKLGLSYPTDTGVSKAYVDWMTSGGADHVLLIPHKTTLKQLRHYLEHIHALVIPGGNDDIHHPSLPYYQRIQFALQYAQQHKLPVFGICAGFMAMVSFELGTWPMHVTVYNVLSTKGSQKVITSSISKRLLESSDALAYNHHYGVNRKLFRTDSPMRVIAVAPQGYASILHWKTVPWIATQWHPEKPKWESSRYQTIPRTKEAIAIGESMANQLVGYARTYAKTKAPFRRITTGKWLLTSIPTNELKRFDMPSQLYVLST